MSVTSPLFAPIPIFSCPEAKGDGGDKNAEDGGKKPEDEGNKPEDAGNKPEDAGNKPEDAGKPEDGGKKPEDECHPSVSSSWFAPMPTWTTCPEAKDQGGDKKPEGGDNKPEGEGNKPEDECHPSLSSSFAPMPTWTCPGGDKGVGGGGVGPVLPVPPLPPRPPGDADKPDPGTDRDKPKPDPNTDQDKPKPDPNTDQDKPKPDPNTDQDKPKPDEEKEKPKDSCRELFGDGPQDRKPSFNPCPKPAPEESSKPEDENKPEDDCPPPVFMSPLISMPLVIDCPKDKPKDDEELDGCPVENSGAANAAPAAYVTSAINVAPAAYVTSGMAKPQPYPAPTVGKPLWNVTWNATDVHEPGDNGWEEMLKGIRGAVGEQTTGDENAYGTVTIRTPQGPEVKIYLAANNLYVIGFSKNDEEPYRVKDPDGKLNLGKMICGKSTEIGMTSDYQDLRSKGNVSAEDMKYGKNSVNQAFETIIKHSGTNSSQELARAFLTLATVISEAARFPSVQRNLEKSLGEKATGDDVNLGFANQQIVTEWDHLSRLARNEPGTSPVKLTDARGKEHVFSTPEEAQKLLGIVKGPINGST
jgi:ribosome inactivating protein